MIIKTISGIAICAVLLIAPVVASAKPSTRVLQLPRAAGIVIDGGPMVSAAGDVNGDGIPDVLVSEGYGYNNLDPSTAGRVYVIFGNPDIRDINVDYLGDNGFEIIGPSPGANATITAKAGDVNGDGLDDILIGAPGASTAYVVFGKTDTNPVPLILFDSFAQGPMGFRISGDGGFFGRMVSGAGDINGDGLDDLIIAAPLRSTAYVVFGKADFLPMEMYLFHRGLQDDAGYLIATPTPSGDGCFDVAGLGDVNGDGIPDVGVGTCSEYIRGDGSHRAWVTWGKGTPETIDVRDLGGGGFLIKGTTTIAPAGDVNGDGRADVAIEGGVLFGKATRSTVNAWLGVEPHGFRLRGHFGNAVDGAGDVNGDGLDDFITGYGGTNYAGESAGSAYVVFGKRSIKPIPEDSMGHHGFRIDGPSSNAYAGNWLAGVGDINGDGLADVAIGAGERVYIVWGRR